MPILHKNIVKKIKAMRKNKHPNNGGLIAIKPRMSTITNIIPMI